MISFSYLKHNKFFEKIPWQHFGTQSSLWVKFNFDPMVRWRGFDKINVHIIYLIKFQ
jgi:hypothetical protein